MAVVLQDVLRLTLGARVEDGRLVASLVLVHRVDLELRPRRHGGVLQQLHLLRTDAP